MYLKSLKLVGFKSFADRTRLEFEPGVTVVVGPNGSGKSNIVDALSWVMGTQATKHLRTDKMEDLIFAGTTTRPAHTRAEVTLVLDNSDGVIPLDLTEVSLTRRLYRDGTSEYEINGTPCRLLDIQELLSDTHVGRHQHVIVAQGQVTSILNALPEEHRAVIDEAAGVLKHRTRRERSARRLERTEADILRATDILTELKRQLRPLRRQAEAADRHDSVADRARRLRLFLAGEELRRLDAGLATATTEHDSLAVSARHRESELSQVGTALVELEQTTGETGRSLAADTAAAARLETAAERLARLAQVAHERRRSLLAASEMTAERRRDIEEERARLTQDSAEAEEQLRVALLEATLAEQQVNLNEEEERSLANEQGLPAEAVLSSVRSELGSLEAASSRDRRELEGLAHRLEVVRETLEGESLQIEQLKEEGRRVDKSAVESQERYQETSQQRIRLQTDWERAELEHDQARLAAAEARARLEATEKSRVGTLIQPPGTLGRLIDALDVPSHLRAAVTAGLGPWEASWVAPDVGRLSSALRSLSEGGAVVARVAGREAPARELAAKTGLTALVDELGEEADQVLALSLLGDVLLVDGWGSAWKLISEYPDLRAVTPEGHLVTKHGVALAAGTDRLVEARKGVEESSAGLSRAEFGLTSAYRAFEGARAIERADLEALESAEASLSGISSALARLEMTAAAGRAEENRLEDRRLTLMESLVAREERANHLRSRLSGLAGAEAEQQAVWEARGQRQREIEERRQRLRSEQARAVERRGAAEERYGLISRRLAELNQEVSRWEDHGPDDATEIRLAHVEELARSALVRVKAHIQTLRGRQASLRELANMSGTRFHETRNLRQELESDLSAGRERLSELAIHLAELRTRRETFMEGLARELEVSAAEVLASEAPPLEEGADPQEVLAGLEAELRRMGPVNPLAADEYRELSERARFLDEQLADLQASRRELAKVIAALDEEMAKLFVAAFEQIAALYQENFSLLFPGGRGRLRLTEPESLLATGVEIEAQPLGKKVSKMSLLSGGERSLAALAFLFAVFRSRPSPFYVLDEVEAALDDANLHRFLRLIDVLRGTSQVLIVTHQQPTMSAADTLYGVTMEPGGSSQVVSTQLAAATR